MVSVENLDTVETLKQNLYLEEKYGTIASFTEQT